MSDKKYRIYELAKEFGVSSKDLMDVLSKNGVEFKNHTSTINEEARKIAEQSCRIVDNKSQSAPEFVKKDVPVLKPSNAPEKKENFASPIVKAKPEKVQDTALQKPVDGRPISSKQHQQQPRAPLTQSRPQANQIGSGGKPGQGNTPFKPPQNRPAQQQNNGFKPRENPSRPANGRPFQAGNTQRPQAVAGDARKPGPQAGGQRSNFVPAAAPVAQDNASRFTPKKKGKDNRWRDDDNLKKGQEKKTKHPFQKPIEKKAEKVRSERVEVGETISVKDFAMKAGLETTEVIKKLLLLGVMATINQEIDFDTAALVGADFDITVDELPPEADPTEIAEIEDDELTLLPRSPVVTIMGHVDHGKTSLLDVIRETNVTAREAGGITQHIGAYQINVKGKKITFLDTPGHEAFTAMRARGAKATDIAILVVAANDGVMPQTIEAINHAKSAEVPIIVAINKMDVVEANPDRAKQQLSEHGLISEEWGGDIIMVPVSARQKTGIDDLLENILLVAEVGDLKANPDRPAQGIVIEAQLDKGRGPVATILVQKGTLKVGDSILAGVASGKVRALINDKGESVKKAEPSVPVEVLGLSDVPEAGDIAIVADEKMIRSVVSKRQAKKRSEEMQHNQKVSLEDIFQQIQDGQIKDLNIVVKGDVQGSIEALRQSLESLKNKEVRVNIIHSGVGAINESDVMLASASNAIIIGFNVRPDGNARKASEAEKVDIRTYRVIYEAIQDVEKALEGMLAPEFKEVVYGHAEVRQVISIPKGGVVAGSYVQDGKITNSSQIRVTRGGIVIHEGTIESLRRFKDDVKEVATGYECGISIEKFRDVKEGDILEAFGMEEIKRG
jgi:translation initiation factor IF-2